MVPNRWNLYAGLGGLDVSLTYFLERSILRVIFFFVNSPFKIR